MSLDWYLENGDELGAMNKVKREISLRNQVYYDKKHEPMMKQIRSKLLGQLSLVQAAAAGFDDVVISLVDEHKRRVDFDACRMMFDRCKFETLNRVVADKSGIWFLAKCRHHLNVMEHCVQNGYDNPDSFNIKLVKWKDANRRDQYMMLYKHPALCARLLEDGNNTQMWIIDWPMDRWSDEHWIATANALHFRLWESRTTPAVCEFVKKMWNKTVTALLEFKGMNDDVLGIIREYQDLNVD